MIGQARIPALLPEGTRVVHKTGTISGSTNDTGIVFLPGGGRVILTIFTKDAKAPAADRERMIAEIARFAYDYFVFNPEGR
jgi:beta-lactamase class A